MPSIDYFECEDCGFRWKDQGPLFCLNDEGNIEEYILLSTTMDLDLNSRISGDIYETYCTGCDKKIKIYVISNIKEPYNQDSAIEKIEKLAKDKRIDNKTLKPFIKDTDLKDDFYIVDLYGNFYSNRDYHCPNCNSIVSRYILSRNKCPKCNGEIKAVDGICLDKF
ncbi:MAG: hypothetical protein Q4Q32_06275 [Methanobrevibacter sp.]|nr:hypothetical protein [Methanobrevibacter sp.]